MKYLYGPVESRRLGYSLGVSLTPYKTCNFDCIYCQLGKTTQLINNRSEFIKVKDIIDELRSWLEEDKKISEKVEYITLSGSGEPTLNSNIGYLISELRKITDKKIAVLTNSASLIDEDVRRSLLSADLIVPSLDAVNQQLFLKVDRPSPGIKIEDVINGLILFRKSFRGKIWLEVMLIKGVNDDIRHIRKLKEVIEEIRPDKIQINSPVRTTSEDGVLPVAMHKLKKIKDILGDRAEIF